MEMALKFFKTFSVNTENSSQPIISTTHGQVRGQLRQTVYEDNYYCFEGIPYAKPPLGELRFKSPQPAESWMGVRDCTQPAPKCIQYNRYTDRIEGSEDCLYLNIYAKKLKTESPLPVMVYIHGGRFMTGSASRLAWGPDYIMMKDVILVTIGYRLGALGEYKGIKDMKLIQETEEFVKGFLSLPEPELQVPGNAGLKDMVVALQWLKKNYHNFNGDANNVTFFGNSTGSMSVHLLSMAPQCEGLFHKAILLSGVSMYIREIPNLQLRFAKHLGYEGAEDNQSILDFLRSLEPEKLCDFNFLTQKEKDRGIEYLFGASTENASGTDAIITKDPFDMIDEKAWSHNMPLMLGATSLESLNRYPFFTSSPQLYVNLKEHPEYLLNYEVAAKLDLATQQKLANKHIKLHMGEKELSLENVLDVIRLASYDFMYHSLHCYLNVRLKYARASTYLYRFDYDSPDFNLYRIKICGRAVRGVGHVDDLSYIFYIPQSFKLAKDSEDFNTIVRMMNLLTAFAANSDPNVDQIKPTIWEPLTSEGVRKCLNISNDITFIEWPEFDKCKVRDQYYEEIGLRFC